MTSRTPRSPLAFARHLLRNLTTPPHRDERESARDNTSTQVLESRVLLAAGDLDLTFGDDGRVVENIGNESGAADDGMQGVVDQSDGSLYVAATGPQDMTVVKYLADGTLDTSFGEGGRVTIDLGNHDIGLTVDVSTHIALDVQGRLLVAGYSDQLETGTGLAVVRLTTAGSLDTTFGNGRGFAAVDPEPGRSARLKGFAVNDTGQILLLDGYFNLVRLTPDGEIDATFGDAGLASIGSHLSFGQSRDMALDDAGRIVVVGNDRPEDAEPRFAVVRFGADGDLDESFGNAGVVLQPSGVEDEGGFLYAVDIDSAGRIVTAGVIGRNRFGNTIAAFRVSADGSLDTSFGNAGTFTRQFTRRPAVNDLLIDSADRPLIVGRVENADRVGSNVSDDFAILRLTTAGQGDETLGSDGLTGIDMNGRTDEAVSGVFDSSGRLVLFGIEGQDYVDSNVAVARFTQSLTPDTTFGSRGRRYSDFSHGTSDFHAQVAAHGDDGSFVTLSRSGLHAFVTRYQADGRIDSTFGANGRVHFVNGASPLAQARGVAVDDAGRILVIGTGRLSSSDPNAFVLTRLTSSGGRDHTLGSDGYLAFDIGSEIAGEMYLRFDTRGRLVFVGRIRGPYKYAIARLSMDMSLDSSFGDGGVFRGGDVVFLGQLAGAALDSRDRIVLGGLYNHAENQTGIRIVRVTSNGRLDTSFGEGGAWSKLVQRQDNVTDIVIDAFDRVIVAASPSNFRQLYITRLTPGGEVDTSFAQDGEFIYAPPESPNGQQRVTSIALDHAGRIVFGGYAWRSHGGQDFVIGRLLNDGTLDEAFDGDGTAVVNVAGTQDQLEAIAFDPAGRIIAVGQTSRNVHRRDLAVIRLDGGEPVTPALLGQNANGTWWAANSNGDSFDNAHLGSWDASVARVNIVRGDFNGDGATDIAGRRVSDGVWDVLLSGRMGHTLGEWAAWDAGANWINVLVGDFDGNGVDDILGRNASTGDWALLTFDGQISSLRNVGRWSPNVAWDDVMVGDFDGDGRDDVIGRVSHAGSWWVASGGPERFQNRSVGAWSPNVTWQDVLVGDFDGNGSDDIAGRTSGRWFVSLTGDGRLQTSRWGVWSDRQTWADVTVGDYDGDGTDDIAGRVGNTWWVARSTGTALQTSAWGRWADRPWADVSFGDFNGDGTTDVAGRVDGRWFVGTHTETGFRFERWGYWSTATNWTGVGVGTATA